jgi:hypothetical protein
MRQGSRNNATMSGLSDTSVWKVRHVMGWRLSPTSSSPRFPVPASIYMTSLDMRRNGLEWYKRRYGLNVRKWLI